MKHICFFTRFLMLEFWAVYGSQFHIILKKISEYLKKKIKFLIFIGCIQLNQTATLKGWLPLK